jgi:hypothetical protein
VADDRSGSGAASDLSESSDADAWIGLLARHLEEDALTPKELGQVLKLAREVAHGVERKLAPPAAYLAGIHAGRRLAEGRSRGEALAEAVEVALSLLPKPAVPNERDDPASPSPSEG